MTYDFMKEINERLDYMEDYLERRNLITDALEKEQFENGTETKLYKELWDKFMEIQKEYKNSR